MAGSSHDSDFHCQCPLPFITASRRHGDHATRRCYFCNAPTPVAPPEPMHAPRSPPATPNNLDSPMEEDSRAAVPPPLPPLPPGLAGAVLVVVKRSLITGLLRYYMIRLPTEDGGEPVLEAIAHETEGGMFMQIMDPPDSQAQHEELIDVGGHEARPSPARERETGASPARDPPRRSSRLRDATGAAPFLPSWLGSGWGVVGNAASAGMGAEEEEEAAVGGGGGGCEGGEAVVGGGVDSTEEAVESAPTVVACSICLDGVVAGGGERSTARLQCGHEFHLDCIGSAFNAKGVMQCPNCRQIERGNWLYGNASRPSQDINNDEWGHDEDLYDANQSEVARGIFLPFRFQWCPIGRLSQLPSLYDEGETSPPVTFHDFMGQNFTSDHLSASAPGSTHPGPFFAYFQSLAQSASSSNSNVTERAMDGAAYHDHWNSLAGPSDGRALPTGHPIDFHHNQWTHLPHSYSQPNSNNAVGEQMAIPVVPMRFGGLDSDSQQRGSLPSVYGNASGSRSRIPSVPPMAPQFMRPPHELFQQSSSNLYAGSQRSGGMRPLGASVPAVPSILDSTPFSLFPQAPSGPSSMEMEDAGGNQFYAWERDRFAPYPLMPVDSEASWWGSSQQSHSTPDPATAPRRLFGQWIGVGRSPAPPQENRSPENSYRQIPRM